ncbi:hypothetical protein M426DRAFT_16135 [Hypoxylon sp. CI-4A]|nr:hypothetical protein M426DRAFT_16135 [Hypoxylon sp. CI-4A]
MRLPAIISGWLALASTSISAPALLPTSADRDSVSTPKFTIPANAPVVPAASGNDTAACGDYDGDDDSILDELFGGYYRSPPQTVDISPFKTTGRYRGDDQVPWWNLNLCYVKCFASECCNGWPGLGDVRNLTVHEWCHSKWMAVEKWILNHLQFCVKHSCKHCRPECREQSDRWQREMCGEGS